MGFLLLLPLLFWTYPYLRMKAWLGDHFLARIPVLFALLMGLMVLMGLLGRRLHVVSKTRTAQFLNLLLLVLIATDATQTLWRRKQAAQKMREVSLNGKTRPPKSIFLILMDEYASSASLARRAGIDNHGMDSFLRRRGFMVLPQSRSNYAITHFSLASLLNLDYLPLQAGQTVDLRDYNESLEWIRHSGLVQALKQKGYEICNRSIFDLDNTRPFEGRSTQVEGIEALGESTFFQRVIKPYLLARWRPEAIEADYFKLIPRHRHLLKAIDEDARKTAPVFCYAHFCLPHAPFTYGPEGNRLSLQQALEVTARNDPRYYAFNLQAANVHLQTVVNTILKYRADDAIIVVLGDHGYRNNALPDEARGQFENLAAVYVPGGDYAGFREEMTNVNLMRQVVQAATETAFRPLPDQCIPLQESAGLDW
jgi:hypothetical protein